MRLSLQNSIKSAKNDTSVIWKIYIKKGYDQQATPGSDLFQNVRLSL